MVWLVPLYVLSVHQPLAVALPSPKEAALATIGAAEAVLEFLPGTTRRRYQFAIAGAGLLVLWFGSYEAFKERRNPRWVPDDLDTGGDDDLD